jgi:Protein of unknown function DUF262/Protein of unknown function (DUF1524)
MQAHPRTPAEIFGYHLRYVVPLFQRPYVWNVDDQWAPLWNDVRTIAERLLEVGPQPFGTPSIPPHFLGAIVVEQRQGVVGFIAVWHVVDGQQRLTTLQLLLDAAQEVVEKHGVAMDAQALRVLVLNEPNIAQHRDEVFKVWPTDRDQDAFRAAMDNAAVVPAELERSRIAEAHAFFKGKITEWAEVTGDPAKAQQRLNALVRALRDHLKIVVIDLEPGDNAQVIFETLNHRGSPLLAADLVKNLVFQIAQAQQLDVLSLYREHWRSLDGDYWRELTAQGRLYRPRIDIFLNYWLTMKLLREVPNDRVFADFRDQLAAKHPAVGDLITEVASDAAVFSKLDSFPADSVEGNFHYRVIRALDTGAVTPVLLWLLRWPEAELPVEQRHRALRAIESWLVRRTLARLTGKNVNQVVLDLLQVLDEAGPSAAGERTETFLAAQTADSTLWPDDQLVWSSLAQAPVYTALLRPRLRMILEALEDDLRRSDYGEGQACPRGLTVEHVMPRGWREYWALETDDAAAEVRRDQHVQRLGNLTLVSGRHNSALSNRPWVKDDDKGKRDYLLQHSHLKLNARIVSEHPDMWTEIDITARTAAMTDRLLTLWPRPASALATPVNEAAYETEPTASVNMDEIADEGDDESVSSHEGKYRALWRWLRLQDSDEIRLSFADVEQILAMPLPPAARNHKTHWYGYRGTALGRAIRDAGWKASQVNLTDERVTFVKAEDD